MKHVRSISLVLLFTGMLAAVGFAQEKKDVIVLQTDKGTRRVTGRVLQETWKAVQVDRNDDGRADEAFNTDDVRRIEYAERPRYMIEAILLKREPKALIEKLSRAYVDNSTPKCVLQHAYYEIATIWAEMARQDPAVLPKAVDAYGQLFTKIPDTRYAVTGRIELGNLLLEMGKTDEALRQFQALMSGFDPAVARQGKLMVARAELTLKQYDKAEKHLQELAGEPGGDGAELSQEVRLLRSRSQVGQGKLDATYRGIEVVLSEKPAHRILGMAYCVLGDLFAAKGQPETALRAYLKVPLMYPETDAPEKARAVQQAEAMLEKLGRADEAKTLKKQLGE